jgi:hypothetical protein
VVSVEEIAVQEMVVPGLVGFGHFGFDIAIEFETAGLGIDLEVVGFDNIVALNTAPDTAGLDIVGFDTAEPDIAVPDIAHSDVVQRRPDGDVWHLGRL